jgi:hypothetical protein
MKPEQERDQPRWSAPEYVTLESIVVVEHGRLPIDEAVVKDIMATISGGDVSALPPVHLWRKQPGGNPFLVAGRNRLEVHKRCGREVIIARVITGETPDIVRAVQLIEIDENLNRREMSPALRRSLTKQRKALYEEEHPQTKRGSAGGRAKAGNGAQSQNATKQTPAFIDAHAKQTGRHRATIAREMSEAEKIGDDVMKKIVGTSLDKQSEITALAAMDEHERQAIVDRAVAGEKVSAAKAQNARGPSIPSIGSPSPADPAPSSSAEPPAARRTDGDGNYEIFKSRWVQYCEADFAALPAATRTRFVTEVLGMSVPSGDTSRPKSKGPGRAATYFSKTNQPAYNPGRPPGVPNRISQSTKDAVISAAEQLGAIPRKEWKKLAAEGDPEYPLRGYFKNMAVDNPKSFANIMGRVLPMHVVLSQRQNYYTDEEAKAALHSVGLPDGVLDFLRPVDLKKIDRRPSPYPDPEADEDAMVDVTPK